MSVEPLETLRNIQDFERFWIAELGHLGPLGVDVDRLCYHLSENVIETQHKDREQAHHALLEAGLTLDRHALKDYPFEIWESRWPTSDWVKNDLPVIFDVMNGFDHGVMTVTYEPRGSARGLISAAFQDVWDNADPSLRPAGCEQEDLSHKAASVTFSVLLNTAVYQAVKNGRLTFDEAAERLGGLRPVIAEKWPKETAFRVFGPITRYNEKHEALKDWALDVILSCSEEATQN